MTGSTGTAALLAFGVGILLYAVFIGCLYVRGKKEDARAWAGFIPDCVVLGKRLLADATVPRHVKLVVALLVAYLALPIDLVPDSSQWPARPMTSSLRRSSCVTC